MLTYEGRTEGFNGQASPLGFSEWACVFRGARFFLGPGEWANEPYFLNPISINIWLKEINDSNFVNLIFFIFFLKINLF